MTNDDIEYWPTADVAQIFNLPYRRFVIGKALRTSGALELGGAPQNAILRYGRLQVCVTNAAVLVLVWSWALDHLFHAMHASNSTGAC